MSNTLKMLSGPTQLTASAVTQYTAPASPATTAQVREIIVCNTGASPATLFMSKGADAAATRFFSGEPIPANETIGIDLNLTLQPGELIQAYSGTASVLNVIINGVETV